MLTNFVDFSGRNRGPTDLRAPNNLTDLVRAVRDAEASSLPVHAVGTGWAFSAPCYTPGRLIATNNLNGAPAWLQRHVRRPITDRRPHIAVEAGIKVRDLYLILSGQHSDRRTSTFNLPNPSLGPWAGLTPGRILSPPTLGGAGKQSLAGVVNTGTHGGDAARPPISDYVQALIVVGSGGAIHVLQRPGPDVVDMQALLAELSGQVSTVSPPVPVDSIDPALFPSVLVSLGRFGVVYAYVYEVHDESNLVMFEHRAPTAWEAVAGLSAGAEATLPTLLQHAITADEYLGLVISGRPRDDGKHNCVITRHLLAGPHDPVFNLPADAAASITNLRAQGQQGATFLQMFCANRMTPAVVALQELCIVSAGLVLLIGPTAALIDPLASALASLGALALSAALFEMAAILGRIGDRYVLGDAIADVLNLVTHLGAPQLAVLVEQLVLDSAQPSSLPGTPPRPWLVKGTRAEICDVFNYDSDCFRGDSVELFFPATQTVAAVTMALNVLDDDFNAGTPALGYLSVRFMAGSAATLATAAWPSTVSIEVSLLRGVEGNPFAMANLQQGALALGGRVHWGQENDLDEIEVGAVFGAAPGAALDRFHRALQTIEGSSLTFRNDFSTSHNLDVPHNVVWGPEWHETGLITSSVVCGVDAAHGQAMTVVGVGANGQIVLATRNSAQPALTRPAWRPIPVAPLAIDRGDVAAPVAMRGTDGNLRIFIRSRSGAFPDRLRHVDEQSPGGAFDAWDVIGSFGDPNGGPRIQFNPALASHADGRLEIFGVGADNSTSRQLMHGWQWEANGNWTSFGPMQSHTSLDSAPSACPRRHLEPGAAVTDQLLVVALDDIGRVNWTGQTGAGGDSGWSDWGPLITTDGNYLIGAGGPLVVRVGTRPHVLTVTASGQVVGTADTDATVAIAWAPVDALPPLELDESLNPAIPLAAAQGAGPLWLFGITVHKELVAIPNDPETGWGRWINLHGAFAPASQSTGVPPAVSAAVLDNGLLEVFARRADGMVCVRRQTDPTSW